MTAPGDADAGRRLHRWLVEELGLDPAYRAIAPLRTAGDSNLMFDIDAGDERWVVRVPPAVKNDRSAHDVLREYRVLQALEHTGVPHPRPLAKCTDETVLGRPFYVMEHVEGFSPAQPLPVPWDRDIPARHGLGPAAAQALADLAGVPWQSIGLSGLGRPDGFLERQVPRWLAQLERYRVRTIDGLDEVAAWLNDHRPPASEPGLMHGDFHLRNIMFAESPPARVVAIVDWEMATIGDPLLDLGALVATWSEPGEPVFMSGTVTHWPGMARRRDLVTAYEQRRGARVEHLDYYMALALFKLVCILEGAYSRLLAGHSEHEGHRSYETLIPIMAERALAIVRGAWDHPQEAS